MDTQALVPKVRWGRLEKRCIFRTGGVPTQECIQGMLPLYAGAYRAHRVRSCRQKAVSVTRTEGPPLHQVSADKLRGEKMAPISESCTPNRRYTMLLCDLTTIYLHDLPPEPSAHKYSKRSENHQSNREIAKNSRKITESNQEITETARKSRKPAKQSPKHLKIKIKKQVGNHRTSWKITKNSRKKSPKNRRTSRKHPESHLSSQKII